MSESTCATGQCKTPAVCSPAKTGEASKNGKGHAPRNIFSQSFRSNYDSIDWGTRKKKKKATV